MGFGLTVTVQTDALDSAISRLLGVDKVVARLWGQAVEAEARRLVPVRTGYLQSSIVHNPEGEGVTVEATAHYAGYVEFGTRYMAAQPYLTPAFESVGMADIATQAIRNILG